MLTPHARAAACASKRILEHSTPTSPPSSIASSPRFEKGSANAEAELAPVAWKQPLLLFLATVASVFLTGFMAWRNDPDTASPLVAGAQLTVALLGILLAHEFAHYAFARWHKVPASLPMFIPLPLLSPFGTMGAVIVMKGRIKSRNALLDIGASGPLAGMVVALGVLVYGLMTSPVKPIGESGVQEGQCLLYWLIKLAVLGPLPPGHDVFLNPIAFAGWTGLFVTMLNLFPIGQLDGGHVAYALFGPRQNRYARVVRFSVLGLLPINAALFALRGLSEGDWQKGALTGLQAGMPWVFFFLMLTLMARFGGADHPPTNDSHLSPGRKAIAVFTLILFALLFMPTPWLIY